MARLSRGCAAALLALAVALAADDARATAPGAPRSAGDERQSSAPPEPKLERYASSLTLGYVFAPLLAIPVGAGLFELSRSETVAVVGAGLAVASVPAVIHGFNGKPGHGALTALLLPAATGGALVLGGFAGAALGGRGCDDSDCELSGTIGGAIFGGLLGGLAGYVGYAIYDVSAHSTHEPPRTAQGDLQLWMLPVVARRESLAGAHTLRVDGATAGVSLAF